MFWLSPENRIEACEVSLCVPHSALFLKDTHRDLNWLFDYTIYPVNNYQIHLYTANGQCRKNIFIVKNW